MAYDFFVPQKKTACLISLTVFHFITTNGVIFFT